MKKLLLTFCFLSIAAIAVGQSDARFGTIKVRKPIPVEFFVEIESTPNYLLGDLQNDIYKNLVTPPGVITSSKILLMEVIIDKTGAVVWVEAPEEADQVLAQEAKRVLSNFVGLFQPHTEQGLLVPAQFIIPVRFNP